MPAKKTMKKTAKKAAPKTTTKAVEAKKCGCGDKCSCKDCSCNGHSQLPVYLLIGMLVATLTVLVISVSFNRSVRDIFRPATYIYNGKFEAAKKDEKKDDNGFIKLSAGATIDMVTNKNGFLIIGEENDINSDAFARRVGNLVEGDLGIYRYDFKVDEDTDDVRAKKLLGIGDNAPDFVYIKNGAVYDRIDDVKDEDLLKVFLSKYISAIND